MHVVETEVVSHLKWLQIKETQRSNSNTSNTTKAYYSLLGAELRYEAGLVPELSSQQTEGEPELWRRG